MASSPEPVEYVRVCDMYGAGFFYLPGTETCLRVGGKVRAEIATSSPYDRSVNSYSPDFFTRAEVEFEAASETEWGTLKAKITPRYDNYGAFTLISMPSAYIQLGGLLVGRSDSQFNAFTYYSGDVVRDDVIYYGPYEVNQLTYTFQSETGFSGVVSLEDSNSGTEDSYSYDGAWRTGSATTRGPDVVAGIGYQVGNWAFKVIGGYDAVAQEGAVKARIDAQINDISAMLMVAWNSDGHSLNRYAGTFQAEGNCPPGQGYLCGWGDWAVWGALGGSLSEKVKANIQVAYTDSDIFSATANLKFLPVNDLFIQPEITYMRWGSVHDDAWSGVVRIERRF
ncbi:porin [Rhizobium sp. 2MFCol3.1]|uniref:porin n=1 Tax=Rhizobium sp. 2MFCol3.1 TaxID=1246459 RepID=UPI001FD87A53